MRGLFVHCHGIHNRSRLRYSPSCSLSSFFQRLTPLRWTQKRRRSASDVALSVPFPAVLPCARRSEGAASPRAEGQGHKKRPYPGLRGAVR
eukprot:621796-Pyramimonas_sp.AAC.1